MGLALTGRPAAVAGRRDERRGRCAASERSNIGPLRRGSARARPGTAERVSMLIALLLVLLIVAVAVVAGGRLRTVSARTRRPAVDGGTRRDFFGDRLIDPTNG